MLLDRADDRIDDQDGEYDEAVGEVIRLVDNGDHSRDDGCEDQNQDKGVLELAQEDLPYRGPLLLPQLIVSVLLQSLLDLFR